MIKFWWRFGSGNRIRIRIATLVRRALAEVYTVAMFLVTFVSYIIAKYITVLMCVCRILIKMTYLLTHFD